MSNDEFEYEIQCDIQQLKTIKESLKCYQCHLVQVDYDEMIKQLEEVISDLYRLKNYKPLFMKHEKINKSIFIDDEIDLKDF